MKLSMPLCSTQRYCISPPITETVYLPRAHPWYNVHIPSYLMHYQKVAEQSTPEIDAESVEKTSRVRWLLSFETEKRNKDIIYIIHSLLAAAMRSFCTRITCYFSYVCREGVTLLLNSYKRPQTCSSDRLWTYHPIPFELS